MSETERALVELLQPKINELGYDLYDLSFKGGSLLVVIDRKEPISLEEVVSVTEEVSAILDEADPIEGAYTLDLSSAGAEKRLLRCLRCFPPSERKARGRRSGALK